MKDFTSGNESKLILQFATPMLLGNVFQQLYNVVDSIVIGHYLGKEALAAVGASFPFIFLLISMIIGIASGSTIIIAQHFGARNMDKVRQAIDTLYIFLFFASLAVSIIGISLSGPVFRLIDLPEEAIGPATVYMNIYIGGIIFAFGFNGISAILRGLGDSRTPLYFLVTATLVNIGLDLLFVVVFHWGIAGVAWATVISQAGAFITAVIHLNRTHEVVRLSSLKLKFDREIFRQSLKIGLPSGLQQSFVSLGMLALFRIVNIFGTPAAAAYTIAMRIDSFASMPAMNFAAALSSFVGQNLGANKPERVRSGMMATIRMTAIISILVTLVNVIFRHELMLLFTTDTEVIQIGEDYLLIVSFFYLFFSTMFVVNGTLRGAGDTLIPMFITLFSLWVVRIPLSWYLSTRIGITGIWWGIPIAWFFGMSLSYLYYRSGKWRSKAVVKYPNRVSAEDPER
ncbi:MAG TPA: MATE family efflux transporter [Bacteroidales bacterium]|nr:MATE family efflux transporter [Bacteroidales bacterium]